MRKLKINKLYFIIIIFSMISNSCSMNNKIIDEFENNFGLLNSNNLNKAINEFDQFLLKNYPNSKLDVAYKKFIEDYKLKSSFPNAFFSENVKEILKDNCFKSNFYNVNDGNYNSYSNFYLSISHTKNIDSLSISHLKFIESGNVLFDFSVAEGFFLNKADYNNYFHKRFIFIFFFIKPPDYIAQTHSDMFHGQECGNVFPQRISNNDKLQ